MRKFHIILAGILFTFLFTTCKQFTADIEEDLSYWASEAFITGDTILSGYKTDTNGTRCVASKDGAAVTLTVRNPKAFSFDIPSITASSLIHFNGLAAQPQHGADYTLRQTGPNTLKLTYTQTFLEKNEQGTADLGPTIALKASDGRVFNKAYTFSIKSNSPPPTPAVVLAKTSGSPAYYVLCLQFDSTEMTRTMGSGTVPVHKDISSITINGSPYALLYKDDNSDFQKPAETPPIGSFIEHGGAAPLTASSPALPPASEKWVLYFKTDIEVESINAQTLYTITLSDNKGVVSDSVTAGLKAKFKVEFDVNDGDPTSKPANQYIENGGTVTLPSSNPTRTGYTFGGWYTDTSYSTQWDFDNDTVTHNITLYAKWTPAGNTSYTVKHYKESVSDGTYNLADTDNLSGTTGASLSIGNGITLKTYTGFVFDRLEPAAPTIAANGSTVVKVYYKRKTYTVSFNVDGSGGSISATAVTGGTVSGSPVTVKYGGSVTFTAVPNTGYEVDSWTGVTASPSSSTTATLSGVTAATTVTVKFKRITYTVTFSVANGEGTLQGTYGSQTPTAQNGGGTATLTNVPHGDSVSFTAHPDNGYEVDSWTVSPASSFASGGTTGAANARLDNVTAPVTVTVKFKKKVYTVTFNVVGGNGTISARPQGDSENSTGSVSVEHGKNVTFTAHPHNGYEVDSWSSNVTPQSPNTTATLTVTAPATVTVTFRQKTYTVRFSVADGEGTLQGTYGSQTPTAQNGGGTATLTNVPHGDSVSFTAHPDNGWEVESWTLDGSSVNGTNTSYTLSRITGDKTVTVKFKPGVFNLTGPDAWKKLKEEANKPRGAHTILIDGGITATSGDNAGEILLGRDLIIKPKNSSAYLDAHNQSRIFNVPSGKTLTLKNITLKNGQASGGQGGGVYVDGTLVMEDSSTITDCHAGEGGGVYVNGTFKMSGSAKVDTNSDVYLASGKSIDVTGTLTNTPAAQITLASGNYYDGRVLATGNAEKANFKVTPENGNKYWRYKKKDGVIKFVKAELKVTFVEIKCIRVDDNGSTAEYYWTMKVDGQMKSERQESHPWDAGNGARFPINESFTRTFSSFPVNAIPVNIDIWEDDNVDDDHIAITKAKLTYDYDSDQWRWTYDGSQLNGDNEGNTSANSDIRIGDGDEKTFTEHYFTRDGDTDVTIKISWKE